MLHAVDRPVPTPAAGEVLVHVAAAGVNRPDIMQRLGKYPPPPGITDVPGLEVAGVIESVGDAVTRLRVGDTVCALVAGGGYAEYCVAPQEQCLPAPRGLDMAAAAALPETFFTVWTNLFDRARLRAGESVLVHGGTSGIGTTAIQLARTFGARVLTTSGTDQKCAACVKLGATTAINYRTHDFVEIVKREDGVDVVFDIVGGDYLQRNLECLKLNGRLVQIGLIGGSRAVLSLTSVLQKRLTITGSTLRARTPAEKGAIAETLQRDVWPRIESGEVRPVIYRTFALARAADAHRMLESGEAIGKVVLTVE